MAQAYQLVISSCAKPGREAEYDSWYENTHMGDVLTVPGFLACTRYVRAGPGSGDRTEFVAVYEVETDDPKALLRTLFEASADLDSSDSIDLESVRFEFLKPTGGGRRLAT
ncbi:DUF4286 family protein [Novosphingobium malaysiense]|uniref:Ethyl tert-butyl ether degradation protein EthD n=1 Tax=Novosphingobium malaysiense TaxID=1348853 RepID=A0A0B1ZIW9_9SPHN|nr:DUF4286 family protein [Novosphingobium malaysiense]KHK89091.1 hypothetical protein LK12_22425 [Novosphingobium malaysiense]